MSGKVKSWHYLLPWRQQKIHIHIVDLHAMLALWLVTSGDLVEIWHPSSHVATVWKAELYFHRYFSKQLKKKKVKVTLKQPWPSQIIHCTTCNSPWDLGQKAGLSQIFCLCSGSLATTPLMDTAHTFQGIPHFSVQHEKETTLFFCSFKFCSSPKWLNQHKLNMMFCIEHNFVPRDFSFWAFT